MGFDVVFSSDEAFDGDFKEFYSIQNDYNNLKNIPSLNSQPIIGDLDAIDYGFGTIYTYDAGNDPGTVPVIGQTGKLEAEIIPTLNYVTSVNAKTGEVVLTNTDVGALSADTDYIATANVNGNILTVTNSDGTSFSSGDTTYSDATTTVSGLMSTTDKTKLDGIESGAQVNTVTSVNDKTGAVTLTYTDVGAQSSTDNSLTTTNKTIVGAINELHSTIGTLNDSLEATLNGV